VILSRYGILVLNKLHCNSLLFFFNLFKGYFLNWSVIYLYITFTFKIFNCTSIILNLLLLTNQNYLPSNICVNELFYVLYYLFNINLLSKI